MIVKNAKVAAKPRREKTVKKGLDRLADEGCVQAKKCVLATRIANVNADTVVGRAFLRVNKVVPRGVC